MKLSTVIVICCLIAVTTLAAVVGGLFYNGSIWFNSPSLANYPVRGIDVSHHQGEIHWNSLKEQNITFVFIKACEGDDFKDSRFDYNWEASRQAGLIRGGYLFYSLRIPGVSQARNFISTVPREQGTLPPVIDLEFGGNSKVRPARNVFLQELDQCIKTLESYYGKKPILYITYEFYEIYLKGHTTGCPLWIRDIFSIPSLPGEPKPLWSFWQYSNRGRCEGIEGFVDMNVFKGSIADFYYLCR